MWQNRTLLLFFYGLQRDLTALQFSKPGIHPVDGFIPGGDFGDLDRPTSGRDKLYRQAARINPLEIRQCDLPDETITLTSMTPAMQQVDPDAMVPHVPGRKIGAFAGASSD